MDHVAILKSSWHLTEKILSGEKTIESRWYQAKFVPYDRIHPGETVYLKNSGRPVTGKVIVRSVKQFADLTPDLVRSILDRYGQAIGIEKSSLGKFARRFGDKRYAVLIFLKDAAAVRPFEIDKSGFGNMAAWITVSDIKKIKKD